MTKLPDGTERKVITFSLKGNFKPVDEELSYKVDDIVYGSVPTDLNGTYLKNSANQ